MTMNICMAQINTLVGDIRGNLSRVLEVCADQHDKGAHLVIFPELTLTGYPPEDLLLRSDLISRTADALEALCADLRPELAVVVGYPRRDGTHLFNSAGVIFGGELIAEYDKQCLPNYQVFDEKRYFDSGEKPCVVEMEGLRFGLTICEDIWEESGPGKALCSKGGVDLLLNISSSPFHKGKGKKRKKMIQQRARSYCSHIAYVNLVGGQDELVFDGQSMMVAPDGKIITQGNSFTEELIFSDIAILPKPKKNPSSKINSYRAPAGLSKQKKYPVPPSHVFRDKTEVEEIYSALVLGTRDYILKNGFSKVYETIEVKL